MSFNESPATTRNNLLLYTMSYATVVGSSPKM